MTDAFHRLGLPRRFVLDAAELERAYLAHSRAVHPDYHLAGASADLERESGTVGGGQRGVQHPPRPVHPRRAPAGARRRAERGEHKQMPPAFLAEMLDAREQIEAGSRERRPKRLTTRGRRSTAASTTLMDDVGGLFADARRATAPNDRGAREPACRRSGVC